MTQTEEILQLRKELAAEKEKNLQLHKKIGSMEGDTKAVISAFGRVLDTFHISTDDFKKDKNSMISKLPMLMNNVTRTLMGGGFEIIQSDFQSVAPIFVKYKHLYEESSDNDTGK